MTNFHIFSLTAKFPGDLSISVHLHLFSLLTSPLYCACRILSHYAFIISHFVVLHLFCFMCTLSYKFFFVPKEEV